MKVLIRANQENKPFSKYNGFYNVILEDNTTNFGTAFFDTLWDSRLVKSTRAIDNSDYSHTFLVVDLPDTPITFEELLDIYPELLL